jgi:hypothetical protein
MLLLGVIEAFVVHAFNLEHHADIAGLRHKNGVIPEAIKADVVIQFRCLPPRLDRSRNVEH